MDKDEHIYGARQSRQQTPNGKRLAAYKDDTLVRKAARRRWYASKRRRQQRKREDQDIGSGSDSGHHSPPIMFGERREPSPPFPALIIGADEWDPVGYPSPVPQQLGFWSRLLRFW